MNPPRVHLRREFSRGSPHHPPSDRTPPYTYGSGPSFARAPARSRASLRAKIHTNVSSSALVPRARLFINQPHHRSIGRRRPITATTTVVVTPTRHHRASLSPLSRAHVPADAAANNASRRDVVVNCSLPIDALAVVVVAARRWWRRGVVVVVIVIVVVVVVIVIVIVVIIGRRGRERRRNVRHSEDARARLGA